MELWVVVLLLAVSAGFIIGLIILRRTSRSKGTQKQQQIPKEPASEEQKKRLIESEKDLAQKKDEYLKLINLIRAKQARIPKREEKQELIDPTGRTLYFDKGEIKGGLDRLRAIADSEIFEELSKVLIPRMKKIDAQLDQQLAIEKEEETREEAKPVKKLRGYKFRLTGVPPDQSINTLDIDINSSVADVKEIVKRAYRLNPSLNIQFVYKEKVMPDNLRFAKVGIHPKKDIITVMATQAGPPPEEALQLVKVNNMFIFHKETGLCLYQQSSGMQIDDGIIGGFLTAIESFAKEVSTTKTDQITIGEHTLLIVEGDVLTFALNFKEDPPPQFKEIAQSIIREYEALYRDQLIDFTGDITPFKSSYEFIVEKLYNLAQSQELQPVEKIKRFSQIISPTQMKIKKEYELSVKMLIRKPTNEQIKVTIEKKFMEPAKVKPEVEITEFEFTVKEPGKPIEIDLILYTMGFDVDEDTKKMEIPLDRDSLETVFHLTPLKEGRRKIQLEICQDTDVIGRVYFNVNVSKDTSIEEQTEARALSISSVPQREQRIAARLRIVKCEDGWFQFNLRTFPSPPIMPKRPDPVQISEKTLEKVSFLMENAVLSSFDNESATEHLIKLGKIIYEQIPQTIRNRIKKLNPKTLVIESGDILIPWEMVHDGETFWCEKYSLGKILVDDDAGNDLYAENIPLMACIGADGEKLDVALIVANPDRDDLCKLDSINDEIEYFNDLAKDGKINLKQLIEPEAKEINVIKLLKDRFNLVHLSSHGLFETESPENARFVLSDDELTAKEVVEKIRLNGWPIIFANACNMGAAIKVSQGTSGMARSFLLSGALAYIAPIYVIPDELAADFAKLFYTELLNGQTLGDIMTKIRHEIKQKYTGLFWITYTLFGDPTFKLCERIIQ